MQALVSCQPELTGVPSAVAELYRLQNHTPNSDDRSMSPRRRKVLTRLLELGLNPALADDNWDTLLHHLCRHNAPMNNV